MRQFIAMTKALSDPSRVRILMALQTGELCVCQIAELFKLAPSTISKHLNILYQAGLVETRKEGRWIYYRLAEAGDSPGAKQALTWTRNCLAGDLRMREDAKRLKSVLKMSREKLCKHYKPC